MHLSEVYRDFRRNYTECYAVVRFPNKEEHVGFIEGISSDDVDPKVQLFFREFGTMLLNVGSNYRILFRGIKPGTFQSGKHSLFAKRVFNSGVYQRGISTANTGFVSATEVYQRDNYIAPPAFHTCVEDMLAQQKYSLTEAINLLDNHGYLSVALKNCFSLVPSIILPTGYTVLYRCSPVAEITSNLEIFKMFNKGFTEAITGLVHGTH